MHYNLSCVSVISNKNANDSSNLQHRRAAHRVPKIRGISVLTQSALCLSIYYGAFHEQPGRTAPSRFSCPFPINPYHRLHDVKLTLFLQAISHTSKDLGNLPSTDKLPFPILA